MRTNRILIILVLAIVASVALFYTGKRNIPDGIDQLQKGLSTSRSFIKPGSRLGFTVEPEKAELFSQVRFVLAPSIIVYQAGEDADTLLSVRYSKTDTIASKCRLLWENQDELYHYTLTVKE